MKRSARKSAVESVSSEDWKDPGKATRQRFPCLAGRYFFTLPTKLLVLLGKHNRLALRLDLSEERELSEAAGELSIGFRDAAPLQDSWLFNRWGAPDHRQTIRDNPIPTEASDLIARKVSPADPSVLAYLGWLFTNPGFVKELESLVSSEPWLFAPSAVRPESIPALSLADAFPPIVARTDSSPSNGEKLRTFSNRWRLEDVTSPMSVAPLLPNLAYGSSFLFGAPDWLHVFTLPDTAAVPGRDELRNAIEASLLRTRARSPHLEEWFSIVSKDTLGKRDFDRYGRIYQLQHLMRVLHSRHSPRLHHCNEAVRDVFGTLFNVGPRTIGNDLKVISERLGRGWLHGEYQ